MKSDQQQFEQLRRLLALKRHEQPPPGYFNDFSSQVIGSIRLGRRGEDVGSAWFFWEVPWLKVFWETLENKPVLAGGFAVAVCGMLVGGVLYSETPSSPDSGFIAGVEPAVPAPMVADVAAANPGNTVIPVQPAPAISTDSLSGNSLVNPMQQQRGSLFDEIQKLRQTRPPYINANYPAPSN